MKKETSKNEQAPKKAKLKSVPPTENKQQQPSSEETTPEQAPPSEEPENQDEIQDAPPVEPAPPGITQDGGPDPNDPRLKGSDTEQEVVDGGEYEIEEYLATLKHDYKTAEPLFFETEGEADTFAGKIRKAGFECDVKTGAKDNKQGWKVTVTSEYKTVKKAE